MPLTATEFHLVGWADAMSFKAASIAGVRDKPMGHTYDSRRRSPKDDEQGEDKVKRWCLCFFFFEKKKMRVREGKEGGEIYTNLL